jgi:hypothetical protein
VIPAAIALAGAVGLAGVLLAVGRAVRLGALVLLATGALGLLVWLGVGDTLRAHAAPAAVALVVALALGVLAARALRSRPLVLPFAVCLALPFRFPVHIGSQDANLLVPLYAVIGVAWLVLVLDALGGREPVRLPPRAFALPLLLLVAWEGASLAWSESATEGAKALAFYALPFGVLLAVLVAHPPPRPRLPDLLRLQVALALVFAAVGAYQLARHDIWWNRKLMVSNAFSSFFRVNSVFYDPSIYGRFLVVAILAGLVVVLSGVPRRIAAVAVAAIALTWIGLYYSYSQSSFAALIVGTLIAAALIWRWRAVLALVVTAALMLGIGLATPKVRHTLSRHTSSSWNKATSGRASLVGNGIRIALHHPVAGVGIAGCKRAYADRLGLRGKEPKAAASHNTPVTVAAETGIPGLVLLVWLLAEALLGAFRRAGRGFTGRAAAAFGIMIGAIVVHSLFYNALFEDPMFWALLALAAIAGRTREPKAGET